MTIQGLAASASYDVEVRATNAEGTSDWSNPGIGATNAPGANNAPVFSEGTSATRSVSASAPAGTSIGLPVTATDADSGDTLTHSLEGRDAGLFDIDPSSGQLLTKSGVTLIAGETYTVTVAADDGTDIARITVSIEVTAAPPNNPPVFSASSTTRSVAENAAPGGNVGAPVTATDADDDTLTYTLGGADAASFSIGRGTGQITVGAGTSLDYDTKSAYTVVVTATDPAGLSDTITVSIAVIDVVLNRAPEFPAETAARTVSDSTAPRGNVGDPVAATDADNDTLTYTLSGTDAASFGIGSGTGQITVGRRDDAEREDEGHLHRRRHGHGPVRRERQHHGDHHGDPRPARRLRPQ